MDILQTKRTNNEINLENEKVHCKIARSQTQTKKKNQNKPNCLSSKYRYYILKSCNNVIVFVFYLDRN